jgi:glycosyltransferase involved in cell wall biosynthesis
MFKTLEKSDANKLPRGTFTVVVPFREQVEQKRGDQLKKFIAYFEKLDWPVLIVEQTEGKKFNRGALLNVGYDLVDTHYIIYHDVDLLPKQTLLPYYRAFPESPIHIGKSITKYDSPSFLGAVVSVSKKDYKTINGFPNNFWGWGGEDDAFRIRLQRADIKVLQPTIKSGFTELPHVDTRINPEWKNMEKWEKLKEEREGTNKSGLSDLKYEIVGKEQITPNILKVTVDIN